jgi:hypothetical protein
MIKLLFEFKPDLCIKNHQGLSPLTLAAKLARIEVKFQNETKDMNFK